MALALLKTESRQLDNPRQHYDLLHTPVQHGTVVVWERATSGTSSGSWHKLTPGNPQIPALLNAQQGQLDRYISVNEFNGWRAVRLLKSLRACYVDIDGSEDLQAAQDALREAQLPQPSFVVLSGRGMHLYWLHDAVPPSALAVWQRCQDTLIAALRQIGADRAAKDCTRVLRLAGTVNSKNSAAVRGLVLDAEPYNFRHLCNEILGYRKPRARELGDVRDLSIARAQRGKSVAKASIYARWELVYRDLLKIAEWHSKSGIPTGHRNNWLFLTAVSLSWFANPHTMRRELEEHAKTWAPGLTPFEIQSAIQCPMERATLAAEGQQFEWQGQLCDARYKFKRETLFELLRPLIPSGLESQLRAVVSDEVKTEHEREREINRDRVAEGRRKSHQVGRSLGSTKANSEAQLKPWDTMSISRATYYRMKKAGTL